MVAIKLDILLFFNILYVTDCARRIKGGLEVTRDKPYVVYLVKAPHSNRIYDEWLCGGALVTDVFIITSAACVVDVEFMYAIAGYKKYVNDAEIENDQCTKEKKKKVVYTCVPMKYDFHFLKVEKWSFIDIALVKVESPYDFKDDSYIKLCSYIPTTININYFDRFQKPGTDVLVYGWGHLDFWRKPEDNSNYNEPIMRYASSKILDKPTCKKHYQGYANMSKIIDEYMICALSKGEINDNGDLKLIEESKKVDGCVPKDELKGPVVGDGKVALPSNSSVTDHNILVGENDDTYHDILTDATHRRDANSNQPSSDSLQNKTRTMFNRTTERLRKHGICQNDHGGPLVTWMGGNEILIGVASVFRVSDDLKCMGPYLYTSTQCNGAFLSCILTNLQLPNFEGRRATCDQPPIKRGYDTVERYISWKHHPAGAADNEKNVTKAKERMYLKSPKEIQRSTRLAMLAKMAKDQMNALLQQQRHSERRRRN